MVKTKRAIFQEIVDIMSQDYSGCLDKKAYNRPEKYDIKDDMRDDDFVKVVKSYLLDFQDHHVVFRANSNIDFTNGFVTRRYENKLYVIETSQEKELAIGDVISSIDNIDISILAGVCKKELYNEPIERQNWENILKNAKKCTLQKMAGLESEFALRRYNPVEEPPIYSFKKVNSKTCILTLSDFMNGNAINKLLSENDAAINNSDNLIIDVRKNSGGFDSAYFHLLRYIFPEKIISSSLFTDDDAILINCTERNCDLRMKNFIDFHQKGLITSRVLEHAQQLFKDNYGKGFVPDNDYTDYEIEGKPNPANIFILTDCYCGSSGDAFVQTSKKSSKVKVIGRNTAGVTDYSNLAFLDLDKYQFMYPTSKVNKNHINGIGVAVDIYIPWTPEHLVKDIDLEIALSMT